MLLEISMISNSMVSSIYLITSLIFSVQLSFSPSEAASWLVTVILEK